MLRFAALSAIVALSVAYNTQAGVGVSLTQSGITKAKNVAIPLIFAQTVNLAVPDYAADGLTLTNIVASAYAPSDLNDVDVTLGATHNSMGLTSSGVSTHITADFGYKVLFSTIKGQMDIVITDAGLDTIIDLSTQNGEEWGELAPSLLCESVTLNVNPDNVAIKLSGGAVDKIAGAVVGLLKNSILPQIITGVQDALKTTIDTTVNQDLVTYGTHEVIPNLGGLAIDYSQINGPIISSDSSYFKMDVNGTFYDASDVSFDAGLTPTAFELRDTAGKDLQLYITEYLANTMFASAYNTHNVLDVTGLLKQYLNVTVDADALAFVIPQFSGVYTEGTEIDISGSFITKAGEAHVSAAGGASLAFDMEVDILAGGVEAIKADLNGVHASGTVGSANGMITGHIDSASIDAATVLAGTTVDTATLQSDIDTFVAYWIGQANEKLSAGIPIPTIAGINISDVELVNHDGYIELGASLQ